MFKKHGTTFSVVAYSKTDGEVGEWTLADAIAQIKCAYDEIASFTNALPYTCKKPDGSCHTYRCGHNGNVLARMCPTTELWKKTVAENTKRLFEELGVGCVYLDQISYSLPQPCHDASHGHPLGGGEFWMQDYREL